MSRPTADTWEAACWTRQWQAQCLHPLPRTRFMRAIKAVATDAGVLMVVKNYTGDVMNFEMAAEMAEMEGITVKHVVTNDDVAVKDSLYTVGRRGVAGTVFRT